MEEENSVFGIIAENTDKLDSEETFNLYHKNKEDAKNNIDQSAKDLTDFFDMVSRDVPELSEDEVNKEIEKILERTHPAEAQVNPKKTNKSKKVTFKVLFLVALLSIFSFSCLCVVGNNHNISIENGFVTFAKDTIKIVFFGEEKEEFISVDVLLTDLEKQGYRDILFPQEFITNSDEYKVSVPEYSDGDLKQVLFNIYNDSLKCEFAVYKLSDGSKTLDYVNMDNAKTLNINGTHVYLFEFDNGDTAIEFGRGDYHYYIQADLSYSTMVNIAETIE